MYFRHGIGVTSFHAPLLESVIRKAMMINSDILFEVPRSVVRKSLTRTTETKIRMSSWLRVKFKWPSFCYQQHAIACKYA